MSKYQIDTKENKKYLKENALRLLEFGRRFPSPGGSSYYLGDDGTPWTERPRETWITSRMAHVYSIGSMMGVAGCKELAASAVKGLRGELNDKVNGGWYAGLKADGNILPGKQCYAHAFVILAASSAKLAGVEGADELLNNALTIYDKYFWNEDEGLSRDTWNTEFTELDGYRGINANMHTVEAFLAAADTLNDEKYRIRAGRIIDKVIDWAKDNNYRIPEHFTSDWQPDLNKNIEKPDDPFKPYGATPGHGIEWARLITQWAMSSNLNADIERKYIEEACSLYKRAIDDAWNADGALGIVYTTDWNGKPVVHDRMHWTLAEAINTSAVLYRVTKEERYANDYYEFMKYLDETVLDHTYGSWYHQLDEKNRLKGTVWPGKSDLYHAFQAMLIPYKDCKISIAKVCRKNLKLVKLTKEYRKQLIEMIEEWSADIKKNNTDSSPWAIFKNDCHDFDNYLANLECKEETEDGKVPDSVFFCLDTDRNIFVGAVNIRHYLKGDLCFTGGHIGDGIRPSERRKGYGTQMVGLALDECRKMGLNKVLMVCDSDNTASEKTIIANGGVYEMDIEDNGKVEKRYWITLNDEIVETERLILRRLMAADYKAMAAWDMDERVYKYLLGNPCKTPEDPLCWLPKKDPNSSINILMIAEEKSDGHAVGIYALNHDVEHDVWSVSYTNRYDDWGKGYTTEGMRGLIDHAVKVYGAQSFEGECAKENLGSARVMEKLGFVYDHDSTYSKSDGSRNFESFVYKMHI